MPLLFQANATSAESGDRSIPPHCQSTYGDPATSATARCSNRSPIGCGVYAEVVGGTMSAAGFAIVVGGRSVPYAFQSSANGCGRLFLAGGAPPPVPRLPAPLALAGAPPSPAADASAGRLGRSTR